MKKIINMLALMLLILIVVSNFYSVFAIDAIYKGNDPGTDGVTEVTKGINMAIGITQTIGLFVAIAWLIFIGIKYMVASPSEKADLKKHLVAYVTGAVIMFGAVGILEIVENIVVSATN